MKKSPVSKLVCERKVCEACVCSCCLNLCGSRSGGAEASKDASSTKRFQQTQAQVDEVHNYILTFLSFDMSVCRSHIHFILLKNLTGEVMMMMMMMMMMMTIMMINLKQYHNHSIYRS